MRNKLSVDEKVSSNWKIINNILYYGFLLVMIANGFVRIRDKANNQTSSLNNFLFSTALVMFLVWSIINLTYYFKPSLFYKNEEL